MPSNNDIQAIVNIVTYSASALFSTHHFVFSIFFISISGAGMVMMVLVIVMMNLVVVMVVMMVMVVMEVMVVMMSLLMRPPILPDNHFPFGHLSPGWLE